MRKIAIMGKTEVSLIVVIIVLMAVFSGFGANFFSYYNLSNLLKQAAISGIIAIAATIVIISGGIDLSVGSITGMSSILVAILMARYNFSIWLAIVIPIILCTIIGLYNGIVISQFRVPPFIATLGTMTMVRGGIELISEAKTIVGVYPTFASFSTEAIFGIPKMAYIWIFSAILVAVILKYTIFGRNIFAIGCNEEVARLSGINTKNTICAIYALSGFLCGIAGVVLTSRLASAVPTGGQGYELSSIAAAVIGGASLSGGQGSILGTFLGTFLITLITNGGIHLGINPFVMDIVTGAIITIAVVLDQLRRRGP